MYYLEIDNMKNRVHITLTDQFVESEAKSLLEDVQQRSNELNAGFSALCDLTQLEKFEASARPHFRAIMDLCNENGVKKVIRIIPNPLDNFGLTLMGHIHYDSKVPIITCKTLKEAASHL